MNGSQKSKTIQNIKVVSHKALFLKPKHLGDTVILTSAIESLPDGWTIDVLCFGHSADILSMNPRVNNIFCIPREKKGIEKYLDYVKIYVSILFNRYDLVVQFSDDWRGAILAKLSFAPKSIAYETYRRSNIWHKAFRHVITKKEEKHVAELEVDLIRSVGLYKSDLAPKYYLQPQYAAIGHVDSWLSERLISPDKLIVLNPTSRWRFKEINHITWVEFVDKLHLDGWHVILMGAGQDFNSNELIAKSCKSRPYIVSDFTVEQSAALLKRARLLVSIDSFAIHLGSAMDCKIIAIFGPTNEVNWHPWRCEYICLTQNDKFSCRPCGWAGCQGTKISECLQTVTSKMLVDAYERLLVANA